MEKAAHTHKNKPYDQRYMDCHTDYMYRLCKLARRGMELQRKLDETTYLTASEANRKRLEESREQMKGADDGEG
jgi:hypothetical protein